jgi:hypothetical protein
MLNILTLSLYKKKNFKTEEMMGHAWPRPLNLSLSINKNGQKTRRKKKKRRFGMITIRHPKFKIDKSKSNCIKL